MSKTSVSNARNRYCKNEICDVHNQPNELSSNSDVKSLAGVINSSNCVINIDYLVQEEKISFEVFRSAVESNCVFRKRFSLRKSRSCMHLNSTEKLHLPDCKVNKMVQTETSEMVMPTQVLAPSNLGPPPPFFRGYRNEYPVRDTANFAEVVHKESYGVSNFKFPENANVVKQQDSNFCSLDFDGTRSRKKKPKKSIIVKRVRSDINIKRLDQVAASDVNEHVMAVNTAYNLNKFPGFKKQVVKEAREVMDDKPRKKKHREIASDTTIKLRRKNRAIFEFVLTPKEEKTSRKHKHESDKPDRPKPKQRKIIVTSNTLQLSNKPNMKSVELQTNMSDFVLKQGSSVNELFVKRDFRVPSGDHSLILKDKDRKPKKKTKKKKMTMTILPCMEVKDPHASYIEMPVPQKRIPMPRRRIDETDSATPQTIPSPRKQDNIASTTNKKQELRKKPCDEIAKPKPEENKLKEKIEGLFKDNLSSKNADYNKKIDELCSLINSLVKEKQSVENRSRSQSRSRSPNRKASLKSKTDISPDPEPPKEHNDKPDPPKEPKKTKIDRFKITHNEKDSVSIRSEDTTQNIPRDVLKISPRINEMLKKSEFKRKNTMVTYPTCIMPDPSKLENHMLDKDPLSSKDPQISNYKVKESRMSQKKSSDARRNCSSVTFSSQIAIIGDDSRLFNNDVNVKNTLFSINENSGQKSEDSLLKRSKTLPTKQEFSKPPSGNSNVTDLLASMSNSDIGSVRDQRETKADKTKRSTPKKTKTTKPGAIENSTFLFSKTETTNNTFQKRKEYYNNLKLKMKAKPEADSGRQSENNAELNVVSNVTSFTSNVGSNAVSRSSLHENSTSNNRNESKTLSNTYSITESQSEDKSDKSRSKISLPKQQSKKEMSPKNILKSRKDNNLFPYEFPIKDSTKLKDDKIKTDNTVKEGRICSFFNSYPLEKPSPRRQLSLKSPNIVSPRDNVKQHISSFLQSYPLESTRPMTSPRPSFLPVKKPCLHLHTNIPRKI